MVFPIFFIPSHFYFFSSPLQVYFYNAMQFNSALYCLHNLYRFGFRVCVYAQIINGSGNLLQVSVKCRCYRSECLMLSFPRFNIFFSRKFESMICNFEKSKMRILYICEYSIWSYFVSAYLVICFKCLKSNYCKHKQ